VASTSQLTQVQLLRSCIGLSVELQPDVTVRTAGGFDALQKPTIEGHQLNALLCKVLAGAGRIHRFALHPQRSDSRVCKDQPVYRSGVLNTASTNDVIQSIILIDLMYLWGIKIVRRYDEGSKCAAALLIILTIAAEASAISLNVVGYVMFGECSLHLNIITSVLLVLMPIVQLFNFNPQNSLLTTALVSVYVSFLSLIGQYSSEECHLLDFQITCIDIGVSVVLFFVTMGGSIVGTKLEKTSQSTTHLNEEFVDDSIEMDTMGKQPAQQQVVVEDQPLQPVQTDYRGCLWIKWHTYMAIGSIYIAMMATNWNTPQANDHLTEMYPPNEFGAWARISLSWVSCLLYLWTLVAPRLCPGRNFTIE
jgi:hypothetical protein